MRPRDRRDREEGTRQRDSEPWCDMSNAIQVTFYILASNKPLSLQQLPLTTTDSLYWKCLDDMALSKIWCLAQNIQTYTTKQKTNHRTDQRLDPIYHALWVCFLDCKQLSPLLSGRWCRHWNKHPSSEAHRSIFSVLWIQYEKTRSLSFSTLCFTQRLNLFESLTTKKSLSRFHFFLRPPLYPDD